MEQKFAKYLNYPEEEYLFKKNKGFGTKVIHAGQHYEKVYHSINVPIHMSSTFVMDVPADLSKQHLYTRISNPTRDALQECLAAIENGKHSIVFASGMAAVACLVHLLNCGDHVIVGEDLYGGTNVYLTTYGAKNMNLQIEAVDTRDLKKVEAAIKQNTKLIFFESPSNPTMRITDIEEIVKIAKGKSKDIIVAVDNTFMSPYLQNPLDLGADIAMHSMTKYLNGHSDIVMGTLIFKRDDLKDQLKKAAAHIGGCPSPFDCYMAMRGMKTLEARQKMVTKNGYAVAHFLKDHAAVDKIYFTAFDKESLHIIKKQTRGYGSMITFWIKGGELQANTFLQNLKIFNVAVSLGGVESLAQHPASMTHKGVDDKTKKLLDISATMIRLSIGMEDLEDLLEDLDNALKAAMEKK